MAHEKVYNTRKGPRGPDNKVISGKGQRECRCDEIPLPLFQMHGCKRHLARGCPTSVVHHAFWRAAATACAGSRGHGTSDLLWFPLYAALNRHALGCRLQKLSMM
jgi:hypothetical protein